MQQSALIYGVILAGLGLGAAIVFAVLTWVLWHQRRQLSELRESVSGLSSTLSALCSSAVGVDRRVSRLERRGLQLEQRQESLETQQQSDRPYDQAIQLVRKGASVDRLIDELELNRGEAELIVMLHGSERPEACH